MALHMLNSAELLDVAHEVEGSEEGKYRMHLRKVCMITLFWHSFILFHKLLTGVKYAV